MAALNNSADCRYGVIVIICPYVTTRFTTEISHLPYHQKQKLRISHERRQNKLFQIIFKRTWIQNSQQVR